MIATIIQPVKVNAAATTALIVVGCIAFAALFTACGIGVAAMESNVSYQDELNACWNQLSDEAKAGVTVARDSVGNVVYHFTHGAVVEMLSLAKSLMWPDSSVQSLQLMDFLTKYNLSQYSTTQNVPGGLWSGTFPYDSTKWDKVTSLGSSEPMVVDYTNYHTITFANGLETLTCKNNVSDGVVWKINDTVIWQLSTLQNKITNVDGTKPCFSFVAHQTIANSYEWTAFIGTVATSGSWVVAERPITQDQYNFILSSQDVQEVQNVANGDQNVYAQGYSALVNSIGDVYGKISDLQSDQDGISANVGNISNSLDSINDQVRSLTQDQVIDGSLTDSSVRAADDAYNIGKNTTAVEIPDIPDIRLPTGIVSKFPFCLPWDLYHIVAMFNVEPVAPVFYIPIDMDIATISIHKTYTFDMTQYGALDKFLVIFKWFLNLEYILFLVLVTRRIMS